MSIIQPNKGAGSGEWTLLTSALSTDELEITKEAGSSTFTVNVKKDLRFDIWQYSRPLGYTPSSPSDKMYSANGAAQTVVIPKQTFTIVGYTDSSVNRFCLFSLMEFRKTSDDYSWSGPYYEVSSRTDTAYSGSGQMYLVYTTSVSGTNKPNVTSVTQALTDEPVSISASASSCKYKVYTRD